MTLRPQPLRRTRYTWGPEKTGPLTSNNDVSNITDKAQLSS